MDNCPVFVLADFKLAFPAIAECFTDDQINTAYQFALARYRGFGSLCESQRLFATNLAVAHFVTLMYDRVRAYGQVSELETRNDKIKVNTGASQDAYDLTTTFYGSQLKQILTINSLGGFVSRGWSYSC